MYHLDITTVCRHLNCVKIYALFGVNSFSPEIMFMSNLGHLEGLVQYMVALLHHMLQYNLVYWCSSELYVTVQFSILVLFCIISYSPVL